MNVLTKELATAFPGSDLSSPMDAEFDEDEDEREQFADPSSCPLNETHRLLLLRLAPLRHVQHDLEKSLGAASSENLRIGAGGAAPWSNGSKFRPKEFAVTSRSGWKSALNRVRGIKGDGDSVHEKEGWPRQVRLCLSVLAPVLPGLSICQHPRRPSVSRLAELKASDPEPEVDIEHTTDIIASCAEDMHALWMDPVVRTVLDKKGMRPEEGPGLYVTLHMLSLPQVQLRCPFSCLPEQLPE